jgi:hypothetical protein
MHCDIAVVIVTMQDPPLVLTRIVEHVRLRSGLNILNSIYNYKSFINI